MSRIALSRFSITSLFISLGFSLVLAPAFAAGPNQSELDKRLDRIERLLNNQNLLQMYTTQQTLKQEVSTLRGDIELIMHEIKQLKKAQKDLYLDLDTRMQTLDNKIAIKSTSSVNDPAPIPQPPSLGGSSTGAGSASGDFAQDSLSEQESYQGALGILKNGQYEEAIKAFQVFLISYPESAYASNAQYWMAEAYYVLKDYESAVSHFRKVITAYPDSRKTADAYLKLGFSYYELKDWANARQSLEKVVVDHADTTAARLAARRLEKMNLEGN